MATYTTHKEATSVFDFKQLKVSSPAFGDNEFIPQKYTCDGENVSPPLNIEHIPGETKCFAIVMEDPDAPIGIWVHWVVWNIPVTHHIKENKVAGKEGITDFQTHGYSGPCPPSGTHHYCFKIYALNQLLDLPVDTSKHLVEKTMSEYIIGYGELVGLYKR